METEKLAAKFIARIQQIKGLRIFNPNPFNNPTGYPIHLFRIEWLEGFDDAYHKKQVEIMTALDELGITPEMLQYPSLTHATPKECNWPIFFGGITEESMQRLLAS